MISGGIDGAGGVVGCDGGSSAGAGGSSAGNVVLIVVGVKLEVQSSSVIVC